MAGFALTREIRRPEISEIIALEDLGSHAQTAFLSGSIVEGYGNSWSDLDVYVISDRRPRGPTVLEEYGCPISLHYIDGQRLDFEYWSPTRIRLLAETLSKFEIGKGPIVALLTEADEQFVHRLLRVAEPIVGSIEPWQALFSFEQLRAYQIQLCVKRLDSLHEDLCGMMEACDWEVALFVARDLVALSMDLYLHVLGNTSPTRKWRSRIALRYTKPNDEMVRLFYVLQFPDAQSLLREHSKMWSYLTECIKFHSAAVRSAHHA